MPTMFVAKKLVDVAEVEVELVEVRESMTPVVILARDEKKLVEVAEVVVESVAMMPVEPFGVMYPSEVVAHLEFGPAPVPQSEPVPVTAPDASTWRHCVEPPIPEITIAVVDAVVAVIMVVEA